MECPSPVKGTQASTGEDDGVLCIDTGIKSSIDGMANPANAGCYQEMWQPPPTGAVETGDDLSQMGKERRKGVSVRADEPCTNRPARYSRKRKSKGTKPGTHVAPFRVAGPEGRPRRDVFFEFRAYIYPDSSENGKGRFAITWSFQWPARSIGRYFEL